MHLITNTLGIISNLCSCLGEENEPEKVTWTWADLASFAASYNQKLASNLLNQKVLPWNAARNMCASMRAGLAQPDSQQGQDYIAKVVRALCSSQ